MKLILLTFTLGLFNPAWSNILDDTVEEQNDETPAEDYERGENYINQGLAQQKKEELCAESRGGYSDLCTEDKKAFDGGMNRKLETMLPALTTAYGMISMAGGNNFDAKVSKEDGSEGFQMKQEKGPDGEMVDTDKAKTEEKKDYCSYIAMVSEAGATAYTKLQNDKTEANFQKTKGETAQAASFYALADNQKSMAKSAKFQFYSWTGTAACYVAYATQAQYQGDWKVWAKLGASTFIASFYKKKVDAHKERAKLLEQMASELPQKGDCNPFTDASCFCAQESSKTFDPINYNNVCVPKELSKRSGKGQEAFVCVDQSLKADAECNCAKTNSCADKQLRVSAPSVGLKPIMLKDPLKAFKPIRKGFAGADVDTAANRNFALANKALKKFKPNNGVKLSNKQKKVAQSLFKNGIPKTTAALIAKGGDKGKLPASATSGLRRGGFGNIKLNKNAIASIQRNTQKGRTLRSAKRNNGGFNRFIKKKRGRNGNAIHIQDFGSKAQREAEIVKDSSKGIFEIISYRYKVSAWREFQDSMNAKKD